MDCEDKEIKSPSSSGKDKALSRLQRGFESRWGRQLALGRNEQENAEGAKDKSASSSGLGHDPLKVGTRVQIPLRTRVEYK